MEPKQPAPSTLPLALPPLLAAALVLALAACTSTTPQPQLCALDRGQLKVYDAHGAPGAGPVKTFGDRVQLFPSGSCTRQARLQFAGDQVRVAGGGAASIFTNAPWSVRTFPASARGNSAPASAIDGAVVPTFSAAWGEELRLYTWCSGSSTLSGYAPGALLGPSPTPRWQLALEPGVRFGAAALDEARGAVVAVIQDLNPFAAPYNAGAQVRSYPRGAASATGFTWKLDGGAEPFLFAAVLVEGDTLLALGWVATEPLAVRDVVELRTWSLASGQPVATGKALLPIPSDTISSTGLRQGAAPGHYLVAGYGRGDLSSQAGTLHSFDAHGNLDWTLDVRTGGAGAMVADFGVAPDGRLVVVRDHFANAWSGARSSVAFFKLRAAQLPSLDAVLDGGHLLSATGTGGLAVDLARREVTALSTAPRGLVTWSLDAATGGAPVRSASLERPEWPFGASWDFTRDARGNLWALRYSGDAGSGIAADPARLLRFRPGGTEPDAVFSTGEFETSDLLADPSTGELWLRQGFGTGPAQTVSVLGESDGVLGQRRTLTDARVNATTFDEARREVWTLAVDLSVSPPANPVLSAFSASAADGTKARVSFAVGGPVGATRVLPPVLDARSGELYVPVNSTDAAGTTSYTVEVHDVGTGRLLRSLTGLRAESLALCN